MAEIMALGTSMIVAAAGVAAGGFALEGILLIFKKSRPGAGPSRMLPLVSGTKRAVTHAVTP